MIGLVLLFAGFSEEAWIFTSFQKIIHLVPLQLSQFIMDIL